MQHDTGTDPGNGNLSIMTNITMTPGGPNWRGTSASSSPQPLSHSSTDEISTANHASTVNDEIFAWLIHNKVDDERFANYLGSRDITLTELSQLTDAELIDVTKDIDSYSADGADGTIQTIDKNRFIRACKALRPLHQSMPPSPYAHAYSSETNHLHYSLPSSSFSYAHPPPPPSASAAASGAGAIPSPYHAPPPPQYSVLPNGHVLNKAPPPLQGQNGRTMFSAPMYHHHHAHSQPPTSSAVMAVGGNARLSNPAAPPTLRMTINASASGSGSEAVSDVDEGDEDEKKGSLDKNNNKNDGNKLSTMVSSTLNSSAVQHHLQTSTNMTNMSSLTHVSHPSNATVLSHSGFDSQHSMLPYSPRSPHTPHNAHILHQQQQQQQQMHAMQQMQSQPLPPLQQQQQQQHEQPHSQLADISPIGSPVMVPSVMSQSQMSQSQSHAPSQPQPQPQPRNDEHSRDDNDVDHDVGMNNMDDDDDEEDGDADIADSVLSSAYEYDEQHLQQRIDRAISVVTDIPDQQHQTIVAQLSQFARKSDLQNELLAVMSRLKREIAAHTQRVQQYQKTMTKLRAKYDKQMVQWRKWYIIELKYLGNEYFNALFKFLSTQIQIEETYIACYNGKLEKLSAAHDSLTQHSEQWPLQTVKQFVKDKIVTVTKMKVTGVTVQKKKALEHLKKDIVRLQKEYESAKQLLATPTCDDAVLQQTIDYFFKSVVNDYNEQNDNLVLTTTYFCEEHLQEKFNSFILDERCHMYTMYVEQFLEKLQPKQNKAKHNYNKEHHNQYNKINIQALHKFGHSLMSKFCKLYKVDKITPSYSYYLERFTYICILSIPIIDECMQKYLHATKGQKEHKKLFGKHAFQLFCKLLDAKYVSNHS